MKRGFLLIEVVFALLILTISIQGALFLALEAKHQELQAGLRLKKLDIEISRMEEGTGNPLEIRIKTALESFVDLHNGKPPERIKVYSNGVLISGRIYE